MTMDEITKLATELERHAQADVRTGRSPEDRHPARIAARAALLRAVEGIVGEAKDSALMIGGLRGVLRRPCLLHAGEHSAEECAALSRAESLELEAAKADSWRQAAEGFRRERDEAKARVPDPERIAQMRRIAGGHAAVALACHSRAETAECALAAMRAAHPDAMREAARIAWAFCHEARQRLIADDDFRTRAAVAFSMLDRALASPPLAALSTETEVKP